ncbi:MAG TPA: DUF6448 family protein [Gemmatimonadaceae bacterium]|nr:DUF6448 family protein [Gemmatimonadaceae bacterium]
MLDITTRVFRRAAAVLGMALGITILGARPALAHCDTMDGPVVTAARKALERGTVNDVLIWVHSQDEAEIRRAFQHALSVRKLGPEARELADRYFFETLVRVHRAGEGEPYTGLKPAGTDPGPVVPVADRALANGSVAELEALVTGAVRHGLHERFAAAIEAKKRLVPGDVTAGRAFVAAYVPLLHYAERVHTTASEAGHETGARAGTGGEAHTGPTHQRH